MPIPMKTDRKIEPFMVHPQWQERKLRVGTAVLGAIQQEKTHPKSIGNNWLAQVGSEFEYFDTADQAMDWVEKTSLPQLKTGE